MAQGVCIHLYPRVSLSCILWQQDFKHQPYFKAKEFLCTYFMLMLLCRYFHDIADQKISNLTKLLPKLC